MNRATSLLVTVIVSFIAGLFVCVGIQWAFRTYLVPPATLEVRGVLEFQAQPNDPSASGNPPNGYYVESTATDRFYIEGDLLQPYVGSTVVIRGTISTVCGPDSYPCYPKLLAELVTQVP